MMRKDRSILVRLDSIEKDLRNIIGHHRISLLYLICGYETPPDANTNSDELNSIKNKCYSAKYLSLRKKLFNQALYDHPNFKEDNIMLFKLFDSVLIPFNLAAIHQNKR